MHQCVHPSRAVALAQRWLAAAAGDGQALLRPPAGLGHHLSSCRVPHRRGPVYLEQGGLPLSQIWWANMPQTQDGHTQGRLASEPNTPVMSNSTCLLLLETLMLLGPVTCLVKDGLPINASPKHALIQSVLLKVKPTSTALQQRAAHALPPSCFASHCSYPCPHDHDIPT